MSRFRHIFEPASAGLLALSLYLAVAGQLAFRVQAFSVDAMARNNDARLILFAREPKIANVGFVWMPLPVFAQLPFALVPSLQAHGLAGSFVTALMGASLCALLMYFLRQLGVPPLGRWPLIAAFGLNPMLIMYAANGMSEMSLAFFSVLMVWFYWQWRSDQSWRSLAGAGLAAMLACLVRYEAIVMVAVLSVLIAVETLVRRPHARRIVESALLVFALPTLYTQVVWLGAMWLIMGDPLYFARGDMSNAARVGYQVVDKPWLLPAQGHLLAAITISLQTIWAIAFPFIVLTVLVSLVAVWHRNRFWLGVVCVAWSSLLLVILATYLGVANFELRYVILALPMSMLLAIGWLELVPRWRTVAGLALAVAFLAAAWSAGQAILHNVAHGDEAVGYQGLLSGQASPLLQSDQIMARYIDAHIPGSVLLDEKTSYSIIFLSEHIERFVPRSDSVFQPALRAPAKYVDFILVRQPYREPDAFQVAYPGFYEHGASWAELAFESGPWRLYRVLGRQGAHGLGRPDPGHLAPAARVALIGLFGGLCLVLTANLVRRRREATRAGAAPLASRTPIAPAD